MRHHGKVIAWVVAGVVALGLAGATIVLADYYEWVGLTIGHIVEPKPKDVIPFGATIKLRCVRSIDVDIDDRCAHPVQLKDDTETFSWSATSGSFPNGNSGYEVNWQATQAGSVVITVTTDDQPVFANDHSRQHSVTVTVEDPNIFYVNAAVASSGNGTSWATAFKTLNEALASASTGDGDEIWVAKGTYVPPPGPYEWYPQYTSIAISKGVKIYGGFAGTETYRDKRDWVANETILSGDIGTVGDDSDNSFWVVTCTSSGAVLDGFTITKARGWQNDGGGIYISGCSPTIWNCVITDNIVDGQDADGGGMECYDHSSPTVVNCAFVKNQAGDDGGGLSNKHDGNGKFINCAFFGNIAQGDDYKGDGGGIFNTAQEDNEDGSCPQFVNCVIAYNASQRDGGGASNNGENVSDNNPVFINCTFYGNHAGDDGGGIATKDDSHVRVKNSIIWANTAVSNGPQVYTNSSGTPTTSIDYSDVDGGYSGTGNKNPAVEPDFAKPSDPCGTDNRWLTYDDGLRIRFDSNCIDDANSDAKDNYNSDAYANANVRDALGLKHIDIRTATDAGTGSPDYHVDMGAYEAAVEHVVFISVDGLASRHLDVSQLMRSDVNVPNMRRMKSEGLWTFEARTDKTYTETIPNHVTQVTGRPVSRPFPAWPEDANHGWWYNEWMQYESWHLGMGEVSAGRGNDHLTYEAGPFDVVHDNNMTTAMYAGKDKFIIFEWSYDHDTGAADTTGIDNGKDKIDTFEWTGDHDNFHDMDSSELMGKFISANVPEYDFNFVFLHIKGPDKYGHQYGWGTGGAGTSNWDYGVRQVDVRLGELLSMIETVDATTKIPKNRAWHGNTLVVMTADHGGGEAGTSTNHGTASYQNNFAIPMGVWGHLVAPGDLYTALTNRTQPAANNNPAYPATITSSWSSQPIRHTDGVDLGLNLLGLPSISGASIKGMKLAN